jgi:nicotinamide-nucleotide amidase
MPTAEIVTIGTEILLGELVDTNAPYIARSLSALGVDLYLKTSVGDNKIRIAQALQQALERSDIVIMTGGLGPTVDDMTRDAVALAMGVELEYRPELWEQIVARFARFGRLPTENNRNQAFIPKGAESIENPVGTAPAFVYEVRERVVITLPGVPREMEYLMQNAVLSYIRQKYPQTGIIKSRLLHTAGVGESQIDERIADLEKLSNPTVGMAAHSGQVDVRITAKADSEAEANAMIAELEEVVRNRLGKWVYGVDGETLEGVALQALKRRGLRLAVVEAGLGGELVRRFATAGEQFIGGEVFRNLPSSQQLSELTDNYRTTLQAEVGLGVALFPGLEKQDIQILIVTDEGQQSVSRPYGGPPQLGPTWAANHCLNLIRQL